MNRKPFFAVGGLAVILSVAAASAAFAQSPDSPARHRPAHTPSLSVAATGLDNPRHLAVAADGSVYVAEAGTGGTDPTRCVAAPSTAGGGTTQACVGTTGLIGRLSRGRVTPVLTGIESVSQADTGETLGPSAVSVSGSMLLVVMQDYTVQSDGTNQLPGGDEFGKLITARQGSPAYSWQLGPDLARYAAAHPQSASSLGAGPGETAYDSDPYDAVPYRGGFAIADAAANSVLWLSPTGVLTRLAALPATADGQAVPDSITIGPDGALYVGGLRGVPSTAGSADVYRIVPGHAASVYATGFSAITDLAFDAKGDLLVLEYSTGGLLGSPGTPGALIKVAAGRAHTRTTLIASGLVTPTGLAVGRDGAIYISNYGNGTRASAHPGEIDVFK